MAVLCLVAGFAITIFSKPVAISLTTAFISIGVLSAYLLRVFFEIFFLGFNL
jgi:hypothetical protein